MSNGPFVGGSHTSHFWGHWQDFTESSEKSRQSWLLASVFAGNEGAFLCTWESTGHKALTPWGKTGKARMERRRGESHSSRGSWLLHPWCGNPSSPQGNCCHTHYHPPVLISSSCLALELTLCWHRYLLNNKLHATNTEVCLQQAACLDLF